MSVWSGVNQWHGIGLVRHSPKNVSKNGVCLAVFDLVMWQKINKLDGSTRSIRHVIPIKATGSIGETALRYLRAGSKVYIDGNLKSYKDNLYVQALSLKFIDNVNTNEEAKKIEISLYRS